MGLLMRCAVLLLASVHGLRVNARALTTRRSRSAAAQLTAMVDDGTAEFTSTFVDGSREAEGVVVPLPGLSPDDCAVVDPTALNMLACHFIAHHRPQLVDFINSCAFGDSTYQAVDSAVGDLLQLKKLRFDITGPLEPQNYFRCYEVNVFREPRRADLVHCDLSLEYRNSITITMDAMRNRGAVRGNGTLASAYRWLTAPIRGQSPLSVQLTGKGLGAAKIRLTLQATEGVPFPRLAHVKVTDASGMKVALEDYSISYLGPTGLVARFVVGQMPLRKLEGVVNDALQSVLRTYRDGWPVMGGIVRERLGGWSKVSKRKLDAPPGFATE